MPTPAPGDPAAPAIIVRGHLVTGTGFLAGHDVIVRITRAGESVSDYLAYTADPSGHLHADLPAAVVGTIHIEASDSRPDPHGACGRLWSNRCTAVVQ